MGLIHLEPVLPGTNYLQQFNKGVAAAEIALRGPIKSMLKSDFYRAVAGWEGRPIFAGRYSVGTGGGQLLVYPMTHRTKFAWVSHGTKRHPISAVNAPILRYQHYIPHTKPGGFWGGPGKPVGPIIKKKSVIHPGIKPRKIEAEIAQDRVGDVIYHLVYALLYWINNAGGRRQLLNRAPLSFARQYKNLRVRQEVLTR